MTQLDLAPADNSPNPTNEETEITLGTGRMLALFFGLVVLCATFFGMGYSMGRNSKNPAAPPAPAAPSPGSGTLRPMASPSPTVQEAPAAAKPVDQRPGSPDGNPAAGAPSDHGAAAGPNGGEAQAAGEAKPGAGYFVQIAAVTKQEDAEALVESLKGRQYQAFITDPSGDHLFHVRLGPFADVKEAEAMRNRLVNDGYNPILKK